MRAEVAGDSGYNGETPTSSSVLRLLVPTEDCRDNFVDYLNPKNPANSNNQATANWDNLGEAVAQLILMSGQPPGCPLGQPVAHLILMLWRRVVVWHTTTQSPGRNRKLIIRSRPRLWQWRQWEEHQGSCPPRPVR